jgi:hypothetical protein
VFFVSDRKDMYLREWVSVSDRKHWVIFGAFCRKPVSDRKHKYLRDSRAGIGRRRLVVDGFRRIGVENMVLS